MIYIKPARGKQPFNSMEVLTHIPEHVTSEWQGAEAELADAAVAALNCCRKYGKGILTMHLNADMTESIAIKYKGRARMFDALQALTLWMTVDDAWGFLSSHAGIPVSLRTWEAQVMF